VAPSETHLLLPEYWAGRRVFACRAYDGPSKLVLALMKRHARYWHCDNSYKNRQTRTSLVSAIQRLANGWRLTLWVFLSVLRSQFGRAHFYGDERMRPPGDLAETSLRLWFGSRNTGNLVIFEAAEWYKRFTPVAPEHAVEPLIPLGPGRLYLRPGMGLPNSWIYARSVKFSGESG
jgi:hypothetical protein